MNDKPTMSLAEISGIDTTSVEEFRFENLPVGAFTFAIVEASLDTLGGDDKPAAIFKVKVLETHGVTGLDEGVDESSLVDKEHREVFFISEAKDIGRIKAFLHDIDAKFEGPLGDIIKDSEGHTFAGRIKHRADKNDKSVKYANIVTDKKTAAKDA